MPLEDWPSRQGACSRARTVRIACCLSAPVCALILAGCAASAGLGVGGRPLVYPHKPGDAAAAAPAPVTATPSVAPAPVAPAPAPAPLGATPSTPPQTNATLPQALARYTQATRYGDLLFVSGQIGVDPRTGEFSVEAPVEQQTRQVLENIRLILETNRLTMANVVSVTVYLANINSLAAVDSVYPGFFRGTLPARSVVEVARLPRNAQLEISVVAGR